MLNWCIKQGSSGWGVYQWLSSGRVFLLDPGNLPTFPGLSYYFILDFALTIIYRSRRASEQWEGLGACLGERINDSMGATSRTWCVHGMNP